MKRLQHWGNAPASSGYFITGEWSEDFDYDIEIKEEAL